MSDQIIKICGVTTPDALACAAEAGATHVGFVWFAKSPRHLPAERAKMLAAKTPTGLLRVLLTVDIEDGDLAAMIEAVEPNVLQLHGSESPARVSEVRDRFGRPVIKAIGVSAAEDLDKAREYEGPADFILLDARPPEGATRPGGLGTPFEWTLLRHQTFAKPVILSGGLTPENVAEAIAITGVRGVDASSGVEAQLGVKSPPKIRAFVAAAKAAMEALP
jgi:phosphoribosylanthranilate isomerase